MSTAPTNNRNYHIHRPLHDQDSNPQSVKPGDAIPFPASPAPRQFASSGADSFTDCPVTPRLFWYLPVKRFFDLTLAITLLIVAAPIVVLGVLLVKMTSRGPAFYRQVRLGKDGRPFTLFKLRTMIHDAEAETGPVWSTENDSRVTPVGDLLRRTHIDEFPQLWNVTVGQMSLVGPRPERPEFVAKLEWEIPFYRDRLKVRPGITGLAQLRLRPDATLECVRRKVVYDVYYVRHVNPALDGKLLLLTAWRLFKELYRFVRKCLILPTHEEVERGFRAAVGIAHEAPPVPHGTLTPISSLESVGRDELVEIHGK